MTTFEASDSVPPPLCPPPVANQRSVCVAGSHALRMPPRTLLPSELTRSGPCAGGDAIGTPALAPPSARPRFCRPGVGAYVSADTKLKVFSTLIGTYTRPVAGLNDICDVL